MSWGITELRHPYLNWEQPNVKELFMQAINIRKLGYDHNYKQLMAVGTLDFLSDHYLVWKEINGKKVYVSAMRTTTMDVTNYYKINFPCEDLINSIGKKHNVDKQVEVYQKLLKQFGNSPEKVRYFSGWTTIPIHRTRDQIGRTIQLAAVSTMAFSHWEYSSNLSIASAMPHVKTDKMFIEMGYEIWSKNGEFLSALPSPNYNDFPTQFMACTQLSEEYFNKTRFVKSKWDEREIIGAHLHEHLKTEAA